MQPRMRISEIKPFNSNSIIRCVIVALILLLSMSALAQPYVPNDENQVVITLSGAVAELSRQLRTAESTQYATDPNRLLINIVNAYRLAASSQEPRAYGHVMTLLEQWPGEIEKPVLVRTISAAVLQHNHAFAEALRELDIVLAQNAMDLQAHMIRAQIGLVTGDYLLTQQSCDAMRGSASAAIYLNCQAQLDGVSGRAEPALLAVIALLESGERLSTSEQIELQITAAVLAHRLGQTDVAENIYLAVLVQSPQQFYTLVQYSNLLLEQNRPRDVINLLALVPEALRSTEIDILLAEALMATSDTRSEPLLESLASYFELAFLRSEAVPNKEYARYALNILDNPVAALQAALQNWDEQKEPSDALLLAKAAVGSSEQKVLLDLHQWIRAKGTEDMQLEAVFEEQGLQL